MDIIADLAAGLLQRRPFAERLDTVRRHRLNATTASLVSKLASLVSKLAVTEIRVGESKHLRFNTYFILLIR